MNAKKAKQLRRLAKSLVEQAVKKNNDERGTDMAPVYEAYNENTKNRKVVKDEQGRLIPIAAGTVTLSDLCIKGVEKKLKNTVFKGKK